MFRLAKKSLAIPAGVELTHSADSVTVKGAKGSLQLKIQEQVKIVVDKSCVKFDIAEDCAKNIKALIGTTYVLLKNMMVGVSQGIEKKLTLVGVGYKAKVKGKVVDLALGYSHPVEYPIPEGITIETPTNTSIIVKGIDKQKVGQVAAEIRALRAPEPYKGKGVRYADEQIILKETKKK